MQARVGNRAVGGRECQPCVTFVRPTLRQGQVGNRVVAGRGCSPSIPGSCFSLRRPAEGICHHGCLPWLLALPAPEDSRAALRPPSTWWASCRGTSGRHPQSLSLRCRHGLGNASVRRRLQGRDASGAAQATGAYSLCQAGADGSHGLVPRLGGERTERREGKVVTSIRICARDGQSS